MGYTSNDVESARSRLPESVPQIDVFVDQELKDLRAQG